MNPLKNIFFMKFSYDYVFMKFSYDYVFMKFSYPMKMCFIRYSCVFHSSDYPWKLYALLGFLRHFMAIKFTSEISCKW